MKKSRINIDPPANFKYFTESFRGRPHIPVHMTGIFINFTAIRRLNAFTEPVQIIRNNFSLQLKYDRQ